MRVQQIAPQTHPIIHYNMALVFANSYNENDASTVRDYSESLIDSTGSNLSAVSDTFGYYMDFNGTNASYQSDSFVNYGDAFSYYVEFYLDSVTGTQYLMFKASHSEIFMNNDALSFKVDNGGSTDTISVSGLSTGTWYKAVCTYNGVDSKIYLDDNTTSASSSPSIIKFTSEETVYVGFDSSSNYLNGRMRDFRVYDTALNTDAVAALVSGSQGLAVKSVHSLNVGDLVTQTTDTGIECRATVYATDTNEIRLLPNNHFPIVSGFTFARCGHRWDTSRQSYFRLTNRTTFPELQLWDNVNTHSDLDSDTKKTIIIDKDGFRRKTVTKTANYTVLDYDQRIQVDSSGGVFTITLPASPSTGKEVDIVDYLGNCSSNTVTVDGNGNNINGSTTALLTEDYEAWQLYYNGTNWQLR